MQIKSRNKPVSFKKLTNKGSTLITVLVGVSFLIVLSSIILAVSTAGLRMKQVEHVMKKNFYADEQILDDIYNGIGKVTTDSFSRAYSEILTMASDSGGKAVYKDQDAAFTAFSNKFMLLLTGRYPVCDTAESTQTAVCDALKDKLNSYITKTDNSAQIKKFNKTEVIKQGSTPYQYIFRDVEVNYKMLSGTDETSYEATITTDIVIEIPYINFFRDSSLLLDYAMIGNKGIYFKNGTRGISGNLYAGVTDTSVDEKIFRDEDVPGGLNIYGCNLNLNSNYIISKGDINVRNSNVNVENTDSSAGTQLWVESIKTAEDINKNAAEEPSQLKIKGNMYVANDLELNARSSKVILEGSYYGYNNGTYETREKDKRGSEYMTSGHTQSSSIIINGNKSELDLSNLTTMIIAGVAYVDLQSQAYQNTPPTNIGGNVSGKIEEYATGESLSLITNQYMYLAPTSCLYTSNPVKTSEITGDAWAAVDWFGVQEGFINTTNPLIPKEVLNRTTNESYTYYFLNFNSNKASEYANIVLNMMEPDRLLTDMDINIYNKLNYARFDTIQLSQIWEVKQNLLKKATNPDVQSVINMISDTSAGIYTRGAVTEVSPGSLYSKIADNSSALALDYITKVENNIQKHYKWLYAELDPKEEFSITSDTLPDKSFSDIDESMPLSKFMDFSHIQSNLAAPVEYKCNGEYRTYIHNNDLTIDRNVKGIILCDGNVTVKGGTNVEGIIIASGKIIVEGGGSIKANRSVVQAILDEEMTEESKKTDKTVQNMAYACSYFKEFQLNPSATDYTGRISGTDYTDYISYQNWRKGEAN